MRAYKVLSLVPNFWKKLKALPRSLHLGIAGILFILMLSGILLTYRMFQHVSDDDSRSQNFFIWSQGSHDEKQSLVTIQDEVCTDAPFLLPAEGFIGLLYADTNGPYSANKRHQGIDIFSNAEPGVVPVYAAYDGYLTRQQDWTSAVIIRIPDDPLNPGRQIWTYYAHMADHSTGESFIVDDFPQGTIEKFVKQGTLLGYTGNYNGSAVNSVWVHLHFSIVLDDGVGNYRNELDFDNTVDSSRYLGMAVNVGCASDIPVCTDHPLCANVINGDGGS